MGGEAKYLRCERMCSTKLYLLSDTVCVCFGGWVCVCVCCCCRVSGAVPAGTHLHNNQFMTSDSRESGAAAAARVVVLCYVKSVGIWGRIEGGRRA